MVENEVNEEFIDWVISDEEAELIKNSITTSEYLERYRKENSKSFKFSKGLVNVFSVPKMKSRLHNSGHFISGKFKGFGRFIKEDVYGKAIKGTLRYSKDMFKKINYSKVGIVLKKTALFPFNNKVSLYIRKGILKKIDNSLNKKTRRKYWFFRKTRRKIAGHMLNGIRGRELKIQEKIDSKPKLWKEFKIKFKEGYRKGKEERAKRKVKGIIPEMA